MVEPYFTNDQVIIYHGDALEILPSLPKDLTDLIVTDPPYGIDFQSNRRKIKLNKIANDDGEFDVSEVLRLACKTLKRNHHAYIFGPKEGLPEVLTAQVELIWDKMVNGTGNLELPWGTSHENITFAVYEPSKANRARGDGKLAARMRKGSVLRVQRPQGAATGRHPNEKPVILLRQLIESSSVWEDTILDPFMGSGSTLIAASLEGRKSIGIEIKEEYCKLAVARIQKET